MNEQYRRYLSKRKHQVHTSLNALDRSFKRTIEEEIIWITPYGIDDRTMTQLIQARCSGRQLSAMPVATGTCSVLCKSIQAITVPDQWLGNISGYEFRGETELHPIGIEVLNREGSDVGNFRGFAVAVNELKGNEVKRQKRRAYELQKFVQPLQKEFALPYRRFLFDSEIAAINKTISNCSDDNWEVRKWIMLTYFLQHDDSSFVSRTPHSTFIIRNIDGSVNEEDTFDVLKLLSDKIRKRLKRILSWALLNKEKIIKGDVIPVWKWRLVMFGIRQREGKLTFNTLSMLNRYDAAEKKGRDRWVTGIFGPSHIFVNWTKEEAHDFENNLLIKLDQMVSFKLLSPMGMRGQVWRTIEAQIKKYGSGYIADGTGWETMAGNWLSPIGCIFFGFVTLASGISFTTIVGIIALAMYIEYNIQIGNLDVDLASIFGDNVIMFGPRVMDIEHILLGDRDQNKYQVYLGISLLLKRVLAFKMCRDSAGHKINTTFDEYIGMPRIGRPDEARRIAYYIVYGFTDIVDAIELMSGELTNEAYTGGGGFDEWVAKQFTIMPEQRKAELRDFDSKSIDEGKWNAKYILR